MGMVNRDWRQTFSERIAPRLAGRGLTGVLKVVIDGEAQPYYLSLTRGRLEPAAPPKVDGIVRASAADLEALLAGRMTLADGMLTERIGVSGDVRLVVGLGRVLAEVA